MHYNHGVKLSPVRRWGIVIVLILVLGLLAGGTYLWYRHKHPAPPLVTRLFIAER